MLVWASPTSLAWWSQARHIWAHHGGAARGYDTPFLAPRLWGCLKRFAGFGPRHLSVWWSNVHRDIACIAFGRTKGSRQWARTLQDSLPDCGDVSGGLLVSAPLISLALWSHAHRDIAGIASGHSKGSRQRARTLQDSRPDWWDVSGGLPVLAPPNSFVSWASHLGTPRGGRQGRRHSKIRAQVVGVSQAVCLFRSRQLLSSRQESVACLRYSVRFRIPSFRLPWGLNMQTVARFWGSGPPPARGDWLSHRDARSQTHAVGRVRK